MPILSITVPLPNHTRNTVRVITSSVREKKGISNTHTIKSNDFLMASSSSSVQPTVSGTFLATTQDAFLVVEAVVKRRLFPISRRPHDRERNEMLQSGHVFVYNKADSGIEWRTDGMPWSLSRILGNFLIYREMRYPFPAGERKRATKRTYNTADGRTVIENLDTRESSDYYPKTDEIQLDPSAPPGDFDRNLVGSPG